MQERGGEECKSLNWAGGPQDHPQGRQFARWTHISHHTVMLTAAIYYRERTQSKKTKEKAQGIRHTLPGVPGQWSHRDTCDAPCAGQLLTHSPRSPWSPVTLVFSAGRVPKSQTARKTAGVPRKPHCFTNHWGPVSCSSHLETVLYVLGNRYIKRNPHQGIFLKTWILLSKKKNVKFINRGETNNPSDEADKV